jgi:hypothetical protein
MPMGNPYHGGGFNPLVNPYQGCYFPVITQYMGGPYGPFGLNMSLPLDRNSFTNTQLTFLATLELPNLSRPTNEPIMHNPTCPLVLIKISTDVPKFDGKMGEDPATHITTYHIWCVSNSLMYDNICLHIFSRTLTRNVSKWFIELPIASFNNFNALAITLLTHFQLPI